MAETPVPLALLVAGFLASFAALWLGITYMLGRMSGWTVLQDVYPDHDEAARERFRMQSASLGGAFGMPVNFNGCLTIDACASGVRFRLWRIFGMFQRPFLVPWGDISVDEKNLLFLKAARLRFARWPGGQVTMRKARWNRIAVQAPVTGLTLRA